MNRPGWITPREWQRLQAEADRTGQPVRVKRINPSRRPKVGEIWHGMKGDRCRILNVSGTQVTVLQLDTGHRVNSEMNDFLASYKPPRGRVGVANGRNPKGLNFPKVPAESLKVGDVVMPPEREMRLWMIRDAAEKGMSPTDLGIMLTDVHEGEPDKRGRWVWFSGYLRDDWYQGRRQYPFKFKARPDTPWPVAAKPTRQNPSRSKGARVARALKRGAAGSRRKRRAAAAGRIRRFGYLSGERSKRIARRASSNATRRNPHDGVSLEIVKFADGWAAGTDDGKSVRWFTTRASVDKFHRTLMNDGNYEVQKWGGRFVLRYFGPIKNPKGQRPNRRRSRHKIKRARRRAKGNPRKGRGSEMARARRTSKMWHEFPARGITREKGDPKLNRKALVGLGELVKLDYRSDKYTGRMTTYTHSFKRRGKVKVTADGLVN